MILFLLPLLIFFGCVSLNEQVDANTFYRYDIDINGNGLNSSGLTVLPVHKKYEFVFKSEGFIDTFTIKTCHQYRTIVDDSIIKRKYVKITYIPSDLESTKRACPLFVHAYEKGKGRHSFGMIDFQRPFFSLKSKVSCNGTDGYFNGVSVCQSERGLIQQIAFDEKSSVEIQAKCSSPTTKDNKTYQIKLSKGFCSYVFVSESGEWHRLTTYGFEKVLVY